MAEKTKGEKLKDKLFYARKDGYEKLGAEAADAAYVFAEGYKAFLDAGKTERECADYAVKFLKSKKFREYQYGKAYKPGEGAYICNRGKAVYALRFGQKGAAEGLRVIAAHIDSPRIDLKAHPVYEDGGLALLKTHYYGGIKKYQWVTIPLALHGVICRADGKKIDVCIGEDAHDPVLVISDLLPHLGKDQAKKPLDEAFTGESLNIIAGSRKYDDEKASERVKLNLLSILHDKYGVTESDLISAELSAVPAFNARDVGLDRAMVGAYGQDDRVCAYGALTALTEGGIPERTSLLVLADKEEIGSEGNTSIQSRVMTDLITDVAVTQKAVHAAVFANTKCLSADVNACFDPNFPEVYESKNSAHINCGVVVTKFTGSRGKSGSSDASAEFIAEVRAILDGAGVIWQTGELGKVDQGGGGTVAMFVANHNIDTVDVGVPILSMHAPYELASKLDIHMMHLASKAFWK